MDMKELLKRMSRPFPEREMKRATTALLSIDMQKLAGPEWIVKDALEKGIPEASAREAVKDLDRRIRRVISNAGRILEACREKDITIAHTRIEAHAKDCRDVGPLHRMHDFYVPRGSEWAEFFEEVRPKEGEIVMTKTCSSFFIGTHLDMVLRNIGIDMVIIVGFRTDQCVTTTARDAADTGYYTVVVDDAVTALTEDAHEEAMRHIKDVYVKVMSTEEILARVSTL